MKKITLTLTALLAGLAASHASITISGTSVVSTEIFDYSEGIFVSSNSASFDESLFSTLAASTSFTTGTAIGNYTVLGSATVNNGGPNGVMVSGAVFNLGGNVATGNEIGLLIFSASTGSSVGGDTYKIYTDDWLVANDGANLSLTGGGPFTGASFGSGSVVPEPSTYAALAGLCALSVVMVRRRRA